MEQTNVGTNDEKGALTNGGTDHLVSNNLRNNDDKPQKCLCLKRISNAIIYGLEATFYRIGKFVATHPIKTIIVSVLVCALTGIALSKWHEETEYVKVWLPSGSRVNQEWEWVQRNFPEKTRFESVIIEDENVLTPESINAIFDIYKTAKSFKLKAGHSLDSLCIRAGPVCRINSILELWAYDETVIRNLTRVDIYNTLNQDVIISPIFRNEMKLEAILGSVSRDQDGHIIGAGATKIFWFLENDNENQESVMEWEKKLIEFTNDEENRGPFHHLYIYTARTFDDEVLGNAARDLVLLTSGFLLVFIFVIVTIGKCSLIGQKVFLAMAGLFSIALAIVFTYGVGFATGIMFGPIHQITPFMLLGIGVDDMFVIMQALNHLSEKEKRLPLEERVALTLKHAGVSITVTSVTDIVAFGIGGSTVIPCLSTFCVYASIGVFALYCLQSTYFVACLTLDEKRIEANRNACLPCFKHSPDSKPSKFQNFSIQHLFVEKVWGPFVTKLPVKVGIIAIALALLGVNIWSVTQLKHDFDPSMYLPSSSYSTRFITADRRHFPEDGAFVSLYCDKMDVPNNVDNLIRLYEEIQAQSSVQESTVTFWLTAFQQWSRSNQALGLSSPWASNLTSLNTFKSSSSSAPSDSTFSSTDAATNNQNGSSNNTGDTSLQNDSSSRLNVSTAASASANSVLDYSVGRQGSTADSVNASVPQSASVYATGVASKSEMFYGMLMRFLVSEEGQMYYNYIKIDNITNPKAIEGFVMMFRHVKCLTSTCNIVAMNDVRELVDNYRFTGGGTCFAYSNPQYMFNETNMVLKVELYRNLALAAVCVFFVTLILIANLWTSLLVFICVVCTVIDVAGTMQFWDISIDTASSVILILCFGLAVDYSAHVGHTFMTVVGTNNERTRKTLLTIGPAVFSGGFSTFLAFLLLVNSISYGFTLFFRIFTSVVIFGLFHGLAVLPVILSIIGPAPYETNDISNRDDPNKISNDSYETYKLRDFDPAPLGNGPLTKSVSETRVNGDYNHVMQPNPRVSSHDPFLKQILCQKVEENETHLEGCLGL